MIDKHNLIKENELDSYNIVLSYEDIIAIEVLIDLNKVGLCSENKEELSNIKEKIYAQLSYQYHKKNDFKYIS